jgi:hypothetical protein
MKETFYNVWLVELGRWTKMRPASSVPRSPTWGAFSNHQDVNNPDSLTYEVALKLARSLGDISWAEVRPIKPSKIIPDIPLDPTLPILMAGHLQDRMRKKS